MIWLAGWVILSLLAAAAWAEHQREWKRRRPTLRLHTPTVTPTLDNARLIQVLRRREAESIDDAVKAHLDDVMGSEGVNERIACPWCSATRSRADAGSGRPCTKCGQTS